MMASNDEVLLQEVAIDLIGRHGDNALVIAREKVAQLDRQVGTREHDQALRLLTHIERLLG
jgi:hypothetical protein